MAELEVSVLCPSKVILKQKTQYLRVPGLSGELGILPGHAQMVSELGIGELALEGEQPLRLFISGGYVDIEHDRVTVLADVVERPEDIDIARAKKSADRAKNRIQKPTGEIDIARAMAALARATKRLSVATLVQ
jgi:F-type H+-transporting ATPase subunit epsilon